MLLIIYRSLKYIISLNRKPQKTSEHRKIHHIFEHDSSLQLRSLPLVKRYSFQYKKALFTWEKKQFRSCQKMSRNYRTKQNKTSRTSQSCEGLNSSSSARYFSIATVHDTTRHLMIGQINIFQVKTFSFSHGCEAKNIIRHNRRNQNKTSQHGLAPCEGLDRVLPSQ